jgi:hypothetical protein
VGAVESERIQRGEARRDEPSRRGTVLS